MNSSAISPQNGIYRRRRTVNAIMLFISGLAMAFGLFWLAWILIVLLQKGFGALAISMFTMNTPPPGSDGGLYSLSSGRYVAFDPLTSNTRTLQSTIFCIKGFRQYFKYFEKCKLHQSLPYFLMF
mgnify:CR=1 FL=1